MRIPQQGAAAPCCGREVEAEIKFKGKGNYNTFGFGGMANMTDDDLYRLVKRVVRVGTALLATLASEGLTAGMLTTLGTAATTFDTAIDTQHTAIETRDIATQDRIIKGNNLWAEMVRLCSIGKALFEDTDEAKYNDYVLIGNGEVPPPPAPPV